MTKFLLLVVILATACAAPQSRDSQQQVNRPCVNSASKIQFSQSSKNRITETAFIPPPQPDTDPTNHYYFSAPLDNVKKEPQVYREVPDEVRYNIIFVKVPPFIPKVQEKIDLQPKTDEKTTVYVLVKRPEDPETIELPEPRKLADEKPEVVVVKYNEDKDIQAVIEGVDQSKLFGDLALARTPQVSEAQVNGDLKQLKKEDITQLKLVGDTRILTSQQSTRKISRTSGSSVNENIYKSNTGTSTRVSSEENEDESENADGSSKNQYIDSILAVNNLKIKPKNEQ